jgi:hypothetical protein
VFTQYIVIATSIDPTILINPPVYSKKKMITVLAPKIKNKVFEIRYLSTAIISHILPSRRHRG